MKEKEKRNEALQSPVLVRALYFNSFFFLIYTRINFFFRCQTRLPVSLHFFYIYSIQAMELYRDISFLSTQSKEDRPSITITNLIKDKYREMPEITSEDMIQGYIPSPRLHLTNTILTIPRQRQPRFITSSKALIRPDYCDLCLTDHSTSSAWIRYNERRIDELHKRIDLMLQIEDNEEAHLLLSPSPTTNLTTATVSQRIDDMVMQRPRYRTPLLHYPEHISKFFYFNKVKKKEENIILINISSF